MSPGRNSTGLETQLAHVKLRNNYISHWGLSRSKLCMSALMWGTIFIGFIFSLSEEDIGRAISKVTPVSYSQKIVGCADTAKINLVVMHDLCAYRTCLGILKPHPSAPDSV